jgi:cell division protein FtsB
MRRAAERHAAKLAAKAGKGQTAEVQPAKFMTASLNAGHQSSSTLDVILPVEHVENIESASAPISDARLTANRSNAQLSTGPKTPEGKAKSALNAVKTGLTGRTVVLPTDDTAAYRQHLDRIFSDLVPAPGAESALVQTIADTEWRLLRIAPLEASLYAIGRRELAHTVSDEPDPLTREALLLGNIFVIYRRDLNNLALQERRLRNQRKADLADLQALQKERLDREKEASRQRANEVRRAGKIYDNARKYNLDFSFAELGFDFSEDEYYAYRKRNWDYQRLTDTSLDIDKFLAAYRKASK